jgi:choline transporter-like protein 2/4/5
MLKYFGVLWFVIGGIYTCIMICLRRQIALAIGVCKQAARALGHMPLLIIFPVIQSIGLLLFMIPWIYFGSYLMSSGEMVSNQLPYRAFEYSENVRWALLYYLFIFFWTSQFIVAMGQLVVAISCSSWYFDRNKGLSNTKVIRAVKDAFCYHMGSAAFGSLLIAIIKTIRAIIMYLQKKAKDSGNKAAQVVLCCIQCCMWCLEKCMKFINKNAYIQIAIHSYSFCKAAKESFFLILRNAGRLTALSVVSDIVLMLGKLMITFGTTFLAYLIFKGMDDLNGPVFPTLLTLLLAYAVSLAFLEVFGMAISTILQSFVADEERNPPDKRFADGELKKFVPVSGEVAKTLDSNQVVPA